VCIARVNGAGSGRDVARKIQNLVHDLTWKQKSPPEAGGQSKIGC
jgi:hypothetical protein